MPNKIETGSGSPYHPSADHGRAMRVHHGRNSPSSKQRLPAPPKRTNWHLELRLVRTLVEGDTGRANGNRRCAAPGPGGPPGRGPSRWPAGGSIAAIAAGGRISRAICGKVGATRCSRCPPCPNSAFGRSWPTDCVFASVSRRRAGGRPSGCGFADRTQHGRPI